MTLRCKTALLCALGALLYRIPLWAQQANKPVNAPTSLPVPAVPGRPKIGLALNGGGALGLAHVGVLKWMEEHRIPVTYVTGTSMGGLVGGLYATGKSSAEIETIVSEIPWDQVISGQVKYQDISFRRKEDTHDFPASLEFGLHDGLSLPGGFNSGQGVLLVLDRESLPYSDVPTFHDLPLPFACVATDLVSGKEHDFTDGPLAIALRSTMSIPGLFSPVHVGDSLYVDGSLVDNLPVDLAKKIGADITIAIYLQAADFNPKQAPSSVQVLGRSFSVVIAANELRSMEQADLLVTVPLQDYSATDYKEYAALIKAGYDAAQAKAAVLLPYAVSEAEWQAYLAEKKKRERVTPVPKFVAADAGKKTSDIAIQRALAGYVGKPIDTEQLTSDVLRLNSSGRYLSIDYGMEERDGQPGLVIRAGPKPYAPPTIRPLVLIDGSDYKNVLFTAGGRMTFLDLGGYRSEVRADLLVGSQYELASEWYHPLAPFSKWFVAPRETLNYVNFPIYAGLDTLKSDYRQTEALGGFDAGYAYSRDVEFRLGVEGGYERYARETGGLTELPFSLSGSTADARFRVVRNGLDNAILPRSGDYEYFEQKGYLTNIGAPGAFPLTEGQVERYWKLSTATSLFANASGGTTYGYNAGFPAFSLGGTQKLVAYGTNQLLTNQYWDGQIGGIRTLAHLSPILGENISLIVFGEVGHVYQFPGGPAVPHVPLLGIHTA